MADPRYFSFMQRPNQEFTFELTDDERITKARRILCGEEKHETHVMGRIKIGKQPYNPSWTYYLDPGSINFFQMAIKVCDSNMEYIENHLDEVNGPFLPGFYWCPWDSKLVREVSDS